jgi:uncharacterized membrane-anchored protein
VKQRFSRAIDFVLGSRDVVPLAVKVPFRITVLFWAIKIVSTAMGEALADWLDGSPTVAIAGLGSLLALAAFVVALRLQFRTNRYRTGIYWLTVAMVATFGTMARRRVAPVPRSALLVDQFVLRGRSRPSVLVLVG